MFGAQSPLALPWLILVTVCDNELDAVLRPSYKAKDTITSLLGHRVTAHIWPWKHTPYPLSLQSFICVPDASTRALHVDI